MNTTVALAVVLLFGAVLTLAVLANVRRPLVVGPVASSDRSPRLVKSLSSTEAALRLP
jgi:hypothetical protein